MRYDRFGIRFTLWCVLLIGIAFGTSGCFWEDWSLFKQAEPEKGAQRDYGEDDILWAQECGEAGLRCCLEKEPACSAGLECCTDPNDLDRNICARNCACGEEGGFCCSNDTCDPGLACAGGFCRICGGEDQPCCAGENQCLGELACSGGLCVTCGEPGHPCCLTGPACLNEIPGGDTRAECRSGKCVECGVRGRGACQTGPPCNAGHLLNNSRCFLCGNFNQPCCEGSECDAEAGLTCARGFCAKQ